MSDGDEAFLSMFRGNRDRDLERLLRCYYPASTGTLSARAVNLAATRLKRKLAAASPSFIPRSPEVCRSS